MLQRKAQFYGILMLVVLVAAAFLDGLAGASQFGW